MCESPPVNSLSLDFLTELCISLEKLEMDKGCRGLIITSVLFKETMVNTVGHRNTEVALQLGVLYKPAEALKIGLVDQLVPEDQVFPVASQTMTKWLTIPGNVSVITRKSTLNLLFSFQL
ncbi:hypothetical protein XENOCAPTIV_001926 [Xenoophorus captivus]|uniref:Uncharacterized protein n=1 Tax=Xenoophorus captivus TaxID=1517983 RepID=A0ABV0QYZ3_9TELE